MHNVVENLRGTETYECQYVIYVNEVECGFGIHTADYNVNSYVGVLVLGNRGYNVVAPLNVSVFVNT